MIHIALQNIDLVDYGWNEGRNVEFEPYRHRNFLPGRITLERSWERRREYRVVTEFGEIWAALSGHDRFQLGLDSMLPAVGDWVAVDREPVENHLFIRALLSRCSSFSRKEAGSKTQEQVIATNIDYALLVVAMNQDFSLRRLERYLVVAWESGAIPVVVLNKSDICDDIEQKLDAVGRVALGVPIVAVSALSRAGIEPILPYVSRGKTMVLLGSSGVGKSTIINRLMDSDVQRVQGIRTNDGEGRHTTVQKELFLLPGGGVVIDTPGMRELQIWNADEGLTAVFGDIEELIDNLAAKCRFRDCRHKREPDCAVKAALVDGSLDRERYKSYISLQRELEFIAAKQENKLKTMDRSKIRSKSSASR